MIHSKFRCEFYFIRHGESLSNAAPGLAAGVDHDAPLTPRGVAQARSLGHRLRHENTTFDRVYCSSFRRAIQTTEAMLEGMHEPGRPFAKVDALIEQQIPGWRGVPMHEAYTPATLAHMGAKGPDFVPPEGESHRVVQRRLAAWIDDEFIYNRALTSEEQALTVAVVGHGAATRCLLQHILGFDHRFIRRMALDNCSISRFVFDTGGWFAICINDSSHLRDVDERSILEAGRD